MCLQLTKRGWGIFGLKLRLSPKVLPKATFNKQQDEAEFYETFFSAVIHWATDLEQITQNAYQLSCTYGLAAMDALHVAAALQTKADELITTEKPTKPMHRVKEI